MRADSRCDKCGSMVPTGLEAKGVKGFFHTACVPRETVKAKLAKRVRRKRWQTVFAVLVFNVLVVVPWCFGCLYLAGML